MTELVGVEKINLIGVLPVVERRSRAGYLHFVTYPAIGYELVMAFTRVTAALEIAERVYQGEPFFTSLPVVSINTSYPRTWLQYPSPSTIHIITRNT